MRAANRRTRQRHSTAPCLTPPGVYPVRRFGLDEQSFQRFIDWLKESNALMLGWGAPELKEFRRAGCSGVDACQAFKGIFARKLSPSDDEDPFSLSMDILVRLMLGEAHVHEALLDAVHEANIITCLARAILNYYKQP